MPLGPPPLWYTMPDGSNMWLMLSAFGLGFVGAEYALIFINSQLPDLGDDSEVGEISGSGFAFGYFGGSDFVWRSCWRCLSSRPTARR